MEIKYQHMKKLGCALLMACGLLTACSTPERSAPISERSGQGAVGTGQGYYVVQKGDTLTQIARRHGQSTANLTAWNNLENANSIKVGQTLRVYPSTSGVTGSRATAAGGVQTASVASSDSNVEVRPLNKDGTPAKTESATSTAAPVAAKTEGDKTGEADANKIDWMWPVSGKVLLGFQDGKNKGIDIGGKKGEKVLSAAAGKVIFTGTMKGYGNLVIIKHTEEMISAYAHNDSIMVKQGQTVTRGQQIAKMGNSHADSVKLHFEVRRQGKPVDPMQYLPPR